MQLRVIIPKVLPVKLALVQADSLLSASALLDGAASYAAMIFTLFPLPALRSARDGEEHRGGGRRGSLQRQGEKDPKTKDYLFEFTTSGSEQEVSTNPISGVTGES